MTLAADFKPYTKYDNGNLWSFCRGVDRTRGVTSTRFDSISGYFVDTVTSPFDQDVSALFVGPKGSGKSATVISICYEAAHKIAAWRNDGSTWDEYWNLQEYTACILEEEATRLMNIQKRYVIKNFDDIGIGWGARKWRDEENMQKNDIIQINRTDNCIQCLSVPDQFLIDKVPRRLISHFIEMDAKLFEKGYTTIKMFKPQVMFREDKVINPYLQVDRNKFVNYLIRKPPHDIWTEYKKTRARNKDIAIRRRGEQKVEAEEQRKMEEEIKMEKLRSQKEKMDALKQRKTDVDLKHEDWDAAFETFVPEIIKFPKENTRHKPISATEAMSKVCRKHGYGLAPLQYYLRENFIGTHNLDERRDAYQ
jgi:hypothetical protein